MRFLLSLLVLGLLLPVLPVSAQTNREQVLLFTYFRDNGVDGVHLAMTTNGVDFVAVNNDKAVFTPPKWPGQRCCR